MAKSASAILRGRSSNAWTSRKNNGSVLMEVTVDACRHAMGESGDWTVLANHIARGISEGAAAEVRNIKLIVGAVLPGIKMVKDDKQPTGMRINVKDATLSNEGVDKVMDLAARKVSLSGTAIREALAPKEDKDTPAFDPQDKAKRIAKGLTADQVSHLISALQAVRKGM